MKYLVTGLAGLLLAIPGMNAIADVTELDADALEETAISAPTVPGGATDAEDLENLERQQRLLPGAEPSTQPPLLPVNEELLGPNTLQQQYIDAILNAAGNNLPPPPPPTP